jgi:hypothetical protein
MPKRLVETSDVYPHVVVDFGDGWRVIECAAGVQWVLQKRLGGRQYPWRGQSYCRTKKALLRCAERSHPLLDVLPDQFPEDGRTPADPYESDFQPLEAMG